MNKLQLAILKNEVAEDHLLWLDACRELRDLVDVDVVDLTRADWLEQIRRKRYDGLLASPPGWSTPFKTLFDERVSILQSATDIPMYPSLEEIQIYENKKYLSYWLAANYVPHPKTWVFYYQDEALDFLKTAALPLVGKTSMGGSGSGVHILKTLAEAESYVSNTFSGKGAALNVGPNWRKKGFIGRVFKKLLRPQDFKAKLQQYKYLRSEIQKDFVILQEHVPHTFEWRCVRIGDSFFAHKKLVKGDKASGSLLKGYENPPMQLLDFVKEATDKRHFLSQSVDIFETPDGRYLVNEMQCIFGQSDPYQMLVDGVPGRYIQVNGQWQFEAGDFNRYESFLLRLEHFIQILHEHQPAIHA
ncbi:MAG: hypothetical protein IT260_23015 [Saprospiraceae bacterium]|nr:hypothetical protein [Saprospiraceae bacterium]